MNAYEFEIFIDDGCPICRKEAGLLRWLDRGRGRLRITDISAPDFDAEAHGIDLVAAMKHIHGRHVDGRVVSGMDVFRGAYRAVGLGWLFAPTDWPVLRPTCDAAYRAFARFRLRRRMACDEQCAALINGNTLDNTSHA